MSARGRLRAYPGSGPRSTGCRLRRRFTCLRLTRPLFRFLSKRPQNIRYLRSIDKAIRSTASIQEDCIRVRRFAEDSRMLDCRRTINERLAIDRRSPLPFRFAPLGRTSARRGQYAREAKGTPSRENDHRHELCL